MKNEYYIEFGEGRHPQAKPCSLALVPPARLTAFVDMFNEHENEHFGEVGRTPDGSS